MAQQVTNYKCPNCTGPLHFTAGTDKLECEYCGSIYEIAEVEAMFANADSQAEQAAAAKEDDWDISAQEWMAPGMKTYNCPSCGADLVCEETMGASGCPYCGNPTIVPGTFSGMLKPDYVLPFNYTREQAVEALGKHYGKRYLLPKSFTSQSHLEEIKGVYVPFWLYDGTTNGTCVFEATNSRSQVIGDEKITTIDYFNVMRRGGLAFEKLPSNASTHMDDTLMESLEPYDYNGLKDFNKAYLTGYMADKYDRSAEDCADRAVQRAKNSTESALHDSVRGYNTVTTRSANIHVEQGKVSYALLPVWLLSTRWNDKNYMFAMNGQSGKMVGDLPVNKGKLWATIAAVFAVLAALLIFAAGLEPAVGIIAGLIVAGITGLILNGSMKSVSKAFSADRYVDRSSFVVTGSRDLHVRTERRVERIQRQAPPQGK